MTEFPYLSQGCLSCRLEGDGLLHCSLEAVNDAVLSCALAAEDHSGAAGEGAPASPVTPLQPDLAELFEAAGLTEPLEKVGVAIHSKVSCLPPKSPCVL